MLSVLIKKQFAEIFQGYFIDRKRGGVRKKGSMIFLFILYGFLMLYVAGIFAFLAFSLCEPLYEAGVDWLYFAFFNLLSVLMGTFASVFSTYSGLYLSKDNDLLLSMPIPVSKIILSRIIGVYLMGLLYSSVVALPMTIVYLIFAQFTINALIGGLLQLFIISLTVLVLSCALGYIVARISVKLKNKSFITVIISLVAIAFYMAIVYNANLLIEGLIENAVQYGAAIKEGFYPIYVIGSANIGDYLSLLIVAAIVVALTALTFYLISRSFIKITTASKNVSVKKKSVKSGRVRSVFGAVFSKEVSRFLNSAGYMLNSGLGVIIIPVIGVFMLIRGEWLSQVISQATGDSNLIVVLVIAAICMGASATDTAVPSISLEGKTLWQLKSLPVKSGTVLAAKFALQFVLIVVPSLFSSVCSAIAIRSGVIETAFIIAVPIVYATLYSLFCLFLGLKMPNLEWTNEMIPIKQGLNVLIAIFGSWIFTGIVAAPYLFLGNAIGHVLYLSIITLAMLALSAALFFYLKKRGAKSFAEL